MLIPFDGPLDLLNTLHSGQAFRWARVASEDREEPWFAGVVFGNVVKLHQSARGIEFRCGPDEESIVEPLLRDYLCLDDDLDSIYDSINMDEHIGSAIASYKGMRILRQEPWECLVAFICSANSNIARISGNVEDMARHLGRKIELDGHTKHTFPTAIELAEAGEGRLRALGLGFRAKYVAAVAEMVSDGDVDLFSLREAPYQDALERLTALPGVGDKVANCVLLFSLDKLEAFPVDVWVRRAIQEWYLNQAGKPPSQKQVRLWAQRCFGSYAGYANQYLFHRRRLQKKG